MSGPKRPGKSAAATAVAYAASKKKANAVNLTANTEANLRTALQVQIKYPDTDNK
jgi:hypothetical protein